MCKNDQKQAHTETSQWRSIKWSSMTLKSILSGTAPQFDLWLVKLFIIKKKTCLHFLTWINAFEDVSLCNKQIKSPGNNPLCVFNSVHLFFGIVCFQFAWEEVKGVLWLQQIKVDLMPRQHFIIVAVVLLLVLFPIVTVLQEENPVSFWAQGCKYVVTFWQLK